MKSSNKLELVKILNGGKVTIPRSIRKALRLRDGDYLAVTLHENNPRIVYFPVDIKPVK
jgi:AbrB family looped-hinge helix DNA binding protein